MVPNSEPFFADCLLILYVVQEYFHLIGIYNSRKYDVNPQHNTRGIGPLVGSIDINTWPCCSVRETFLNSIGHSVLFENIFHRTEIISV